MPEEFTLPYERLTSTYLTLEPLNPRHAQGLLAAEPEPEIFEVMFGRPPSLTAEGFEAYIQSRLAPGHFPFAVLINGEVAGTSSYFDVRPEHKGLEIGYTWYGPRWRGTFVNPACKLMMLEHAFEVARAERVQLKTDLRNLRSQAAMEKMGATREGVLRRHMILPDGYVRDTVMFSVVRPEWPEVKERLLARLGGHCFSTTSK